MRIEKVTKRKSGTISISFRESGMPYGTTLILSPLDILDLWNYKNYVQAKLDINEMPLTIDEWKDFNESSA